MTEKVTSIRRHSESDGARRALRLLLSVLLVLLAGTPAFADGITQADSNVFTLDLTGSAMAGAGGASHADSPDFILNLLPPGSAESGDFVLDLTGAATTGPRFTQADSADFILDLTGVIGAGAGGTTIADSNIFVLDLTNAIAAGTGGTIHADSADFILNTLRPGEGESGDFTLDTTGTTSGFVRFVFADSGDFTLDTTFFLPPTLDIGLRYFDGTAVIKLGAEPGAPTSPLRIQKNGVTYGIKLVPINSPDASKIRIQTPSGVKALQKLP